MPTDQSLESLRAELAELRWRFERQRAHRREERRALRRAEDPRSSERTTQSSAEERLST